MCELSSMKLSHILYIHVSYNIIIKHQKKLKAKIDKNKNKLYFAVPDENKAAAAIL